MKLTGHKTENVYRRCTIVAESDLREGERRPSRMRAVQLHIRGKFGDTRRRALSNHIEKWWAGTGLRYGS
jgi:hypothetical protein